MANIEAEIRLSPELQAKLEELKWYASLHPLEDEPPLDADTKRRLVKYGPIRRYTMALMLIDLERAIEEKDRRIAELENSVR